MICREALSLVQAYGDGELGGEMRSQVQGHLRSCERCRREYDQRRQLVNALATALPRAAGAPAGLAEAVRRRIAHQLAAGGGRVQTVRRVMTRRSSKIAFSAAGLMAAVLTVLWMTFGQELAFAKAIDDALRHVKSAHFIAMEGDREVEVWATQEAERVSMEEGWMVAKDGRAYLFHPRKKHVTITEGAVAHLELLRGLNVLMLSERLRGQALGKPRVTKETVALPNGGEAIRISASAAARHNGVVCDFSGVMLVDPATNLILSGEAWETVPPAPARERLERAARPASRHVRVDRIEYNVELPEEAFSIAVPRGWTASFAK